MSHVNVFGRPLARGTLCNRAQSGLGRRESDETFAPGEEAREAGHLPDLGKNPGRRLDQIAGADDETHAFRHGSFVHGWQ